MICIAKFFLVEVTGVNGSLVGDLLTVGHTLLGTFLIIGSLIHLAFKPRLGDLKSIS